MIFIEITSGTGQIFHMGIATGLETRMLRNGGTVQMSRARSPGRFARRDLNVRETHWCFHAKGWSPSIKKAYRYAPSPARSSGEARKLYEGVTAAAVCVIADI